MRDPKPDAYGFTENEQGVRARRHPQCTCSTPCQLRFKCTCPGHVGRKGMPYCCGASDDQPGWCDICYAREAP